MLGKRRENGIERKKKIILKREESIMKHVRTLPFKMFLECGGGEGGLFPWLRLLG